LAAPRTLDVQAYAIASIVAIRDLEPLFPQAAARVRIAKTHLLVSYSETSWAVAHDFGAIVFVDVPEAERERVMAELVAHCASESRPPLVETFTIELAPSDAPSVRFDRVVLPLIDARNVEIVAIVIAQSVGMEYYENSVDELIGQIEGFSVRLANKGRFFARSRELLSFVGRAMQTRTQVIHTLALLDTPALTWDDESLDKVHRELRLSFAIEDRYRGLDHKLRMIQDNLELLVDLTQHTRSTRLEIAVIVLIAIELAVALAELRWFGH
jgi:uncharacterized Rmd1/YagE family protein